MHADRFWTGIALAAGLAMAIILAASPRPMETSGTIDGTVTYRGHPVRGGTITFSSAERPDRDVACAVIYEDGHFRCDSTWERRRAPGTRYNILVVLNTRDYPPPDVAAAEDDSSDEPAVARRHRRTRQERAWSASRVLRASMESPPAGWRSGPAPPWRPNRFSDPTTSHLFARLDDGPARVDVELSD
jgi:hypothetical protein